MGHQVEEFEEMMLQFSTLFLIGQIFYCKFSEDWSLCCIKSVTTLG